MALVAVLGSWGCADKRAQLIAEAPLISTRLTDSQGQLFRFLTPPRRVVALSAHQARWIAAMGGKDLLVGIPEYMPQDALMEGIPRLRTLPDSAFDWEGLKAMKPDFIVASTDVYVPAALQAQARAHGLRIFFQSSTRVADVLDGQDSLASLLGIAEDTHEATRRLRALIAGMEKTWADQTSPRAAIVISAQPLVIAGGGHFLTDMARIGGAEVLEADNPKAYVTITPEQLEAYKPEILYMVTDDLGYFDRLRTLYPGFIHFPAVVRKKLMALPPSEYLSPGPHLPSTLLKLAGVAFPEVHLNDLYLRIYHSADSTAAAQ